MILTCPECATRYFAKDDAIGHNGRTVRCSKCNTSWFVAAQPDALVLKDNEDDNFVAPLGSPSPSQSVPPVAASSSVSLPQTAIEPDFDNNFSDPSDPPQTPAQAMGAHVQVRDDADRRRRRQRLVGVSMIWGVTLGILSVAAAAAFIFRQPVVDALPQTASIYKAFGINVSQSGLQIDDPISRTVRVDGVPVLIVNGRVRNISNTEQIIPPIRLSTKNASGEELASWIVEIPQARLQKGASVDFKSEYPNPPVDAATLKYEFLEAGERVEDVARISPPTEPPSADVPDPQNGL